jgi:regulator of cell morphogenesis and NO signaling
MAKFTQSDKLGTIVSKFPKAGDIFKKNKIDFCCHGDRPFSAAVEEQNLNGEALLQEINEAYEEMMEKNVENIDWTEQPLAELIDHVVQKHHAYLAEELPSLSQYVTKILRVHGPHQSDVLSAVHRLFHNIKMEFEQHMIKEEELVFPQIKELEKNPTPAAVDKAISAIHELESEHDQVGQWLREIREVTNDYELPEWACSTYKLTFDKLQALESDTFQHVHLENNILFPRVENMEDDH